MQSTTNYSMNLVEGTDLVNIPVQLNPNFQTVDAEMFKNKQASVGTATEVVTGTVHAVVRSNTDADMFRFTATGAWTAGDTMTLDGSAVTVHLADGTAPATGAYIIGAEVVAVVSGTLVTLLTSAAQPVAGVTSFNSRTGAVVPTASDYDASMVDYDNTLSGLTATDTQTAIDELKDDIDNIHSIDYSTTEHVVGTWTDGSTLYEKTINNITLPDNSTATTSTGLSNVWVREYFGTAYSPNGEYIRGINETAIRTLVNTTGSEISIRTTEAFGGTWKESVTLRYTKSI